MKTEVELAEYVVKWLAADKWEVFQEVGVLSGFADIVALRRPLIWTIETKLSLTLTLLEQALSWLPYSHQVSICTPAVYSRRGQSGRKAAFTFCHRLGIGWMEVNSSGHIETRVRPRFNRKVQSEVIRRCLREEQKTWAKAGSGATKERWTPFKHTCLQVQSAVKNNPGMTLKDLLSQITHHYSSDASARSQIPKWINAGLIQGVQIKLNGKHLQLYPSEKI